jgi:hypothetical protein
VKRWLVGVAVTGALVAGCGGVENEPNLANAAERTESTGSSRFTITSDETAYGRENKLTCAGAADYARRRLRFTCDDIELLAIGAATYVRGTPGGIGERWIRIPNETQQEAMIDTFSPVTLLATLRKASREIERFGTEHVRGVSTVRYRLTVICREADLGCTETTRVDVWIDDDGLVRRIELDDDGVSGVIEFFDFGVDVEIEPPPAAEVDDPSDYSARPCGVDVGAPITDRLALGALRRHGFAAVRGEECGGGVVASLAGPAGTGSEPGIVTCRLSETPSDGAPSEPKTTTSGGVAKLRLENLQCDLFVSTEAEGLEALRRLEETFDELERTIRP